MHVVGVHIHCKDESSQRSEYSTDTVFLDSDTINCKCGALDEI